MFENILASFLTLKPVCDRNNSTWAGHTAFAALYARFGEVLALILALATKTSQNLTGIAQLKKQLRGEMCGAAFEIAQAVSTWATFTKNLEAQAKVNFTLPALLGGRDFESAAKCQTVLDVATANLKELGGHGVTALADKIAAYNEIIKEPRVAIVGRKGANEQLAEAFAEAEQIVGEGLDKLIGQFGAANAEFVADYRNARVVVAAPATVTRKQAAAAQASADAPKAAAAPTAETKKPSGEKAA